MFSRKKETASTVIPLTKNEKVDQVGLNNLQRYSQQEEVYFNPGTMEKICYKKCISDLTTPQLQDAEKNCLSRCSRKFREAVDFGNNCLLYLNYKIKEANLHRPDLLPKQN